MPCVEAKRQAYLVLVLTQHAASKDFSSGSFHRGAHLSSGTLKVSNNSLELNSIDEVLST
jgi:hypothetical protein